MSRLSEAMLPYSGRGSATIRSMTCCTSSRSTRFFLLRPEQTFASSPWMGLNASSGKPASTSSVVAPSRLLPTRM